MSRAAPIAAAGEGGRPATIEASPDLGFIEWMAGCGGSLAVTTYQAGRLMLIGWNGGQITFLERGFPRCMGLDLQGNSLALAARGALWIFDNAPALAPHFGAGDYDGLFLPRCNVPIPQQPARNYHDLMWSDDPGQVWLVNTANSTLETLDLSTGRIEPRWAPPFVQPGTFEDRCHLNGLAVVDGRAAFATSLGTTDTPQGWRAHRYAGGIVMRVEDGQPLLGGLCMPHSPRWDCGSLYLLDSGEGRLIRFNPGHPTREYEVICELPAFLRGLTFVGHHAVIGMCQIRDSSDTFRGAPVHDRYPKLLCGLALVDLITGRVDGMVRLGAGCTEIYDARFVPGLRNINVMPLRGVTHQAAPAPG